jgi:hypothetical protein
MRVVSKGRSVGNPLSCTSRHELVDVHRAFGGNHGKSETDDAFARPVPSLARARWLERPDPDEVRKAPGGRP